MDDNHKLTDKVVYNHIRDVLNGRVPSTLQSVNSVSSTDSIREDSDSDSSGAGATVKRPTVKIFKHRDSVTSRLISTDSNFQALYNAFFIQLFLVLILSIVRDSYSAKKLYLNFAPLSDGLGTLNDILSFIIIETCLQLWTFLLHPLTIIWARYRSMSTVLIDSLFVLLYMLYCVIGFVSILSITSSGRLPHLINLVLGAEQFRLFMKSYSFIRENAYKVLYPWHKDDTDGPAVWYGGQMSPSVGSFSQYCYFLFCPTLLYRDHYPRNDKINISLVMYSFITFVLSIWSTMFIVTNILYPPSLKQADLINTLMLCFVTTFMIKFIAHNAILNAYLTMTGELLRFADKEFFNEWWSVSNYQSYYRKWNLLVHDWIHAYVYLDLKKIIGKKLAVFGTILVSAIVHEYLLAMGTRFILPIITVLFAGMGGILYLFKPFRAQRASNFFILGTLNFGSSIIIFFLILEFAARQYCPVQENNLASVFIPQFISCYNKFNS